MLNNFSFFVNFVKFATFRLTLMEKYFIPEAEIGLHNVSQKINQNIKLVKEFHDVPCFGDFRFFVKFTSRLLLYAEDVWETKRLKIWKRDRSGVFQFLPDEEKPEMCVHPLIFESIPVIGFYSQEYEKEIKQVKFSLRKIPGIVLESIEIDDALLNIVVEKNCKVFSLSSFVGMTIDNLLYPSVGRQAEHFPEKLIWDINEQEENFWCLLISFQL